jgi:hypothetical protein
VGSGCRACPFYLWKGPAISISTASARPDAGCHGAPHLLHLALTTSFCGSPEPNPSQPEITFLIHNNDCILAHRPPLNSFISLAKWRPQIASRLQCGGGRKSASGWNQVLWTGRIRRALEANLVTFSQSATLLKTLASRYRFRTGITARLAVFHCLSSWSLLALS